MINIDYSNYSVQFQMVRIMIVILQININNAQEKEKSL